VIRNRENVRIERKSSFCFDTKTRARNNQLEKSISKAIQGFANSFNGGILLIGVDPDGKIIGLKNDYTLVQNHNSDGFELELRNSVEKYLRQNCS
jgi:predicted HTH transcriptional regulator